MSRKAFHVDDWAGLNLRDDPMEVGWQGLTQAACVWFNKPGRMVFPKGLQTTTDLSAYDAVQGLLYTGLSGQDELVTFGKTNSTKTCTLISIYAGTASASTGAWTGTAAAPTVIDVVPFGTPTSSRLIITSKDSTTAQQPRSWTGSSGTVAALSTSMKPFFCEVTPNSNRLAVANFAAAADAPGGSNGSPSTVFFSDAGAYDTYTSTNYVHLDPGDGEQITGMASFRDFLIVFKETKFYVFYGESTDDTGNPVFNYRTVSIPAGRIVRSPVANYGNYLGSTAIKAGSDGVYFATDSRLYITDGGKPSREFSDAVTDLTSSSTWSSVRVSCTEGIVDWSGRGTYFTDTGKWGHLGVTQPVIFKGVTYGLYGNEVVKVVTTGEDYSLVSSFTTGSQRFAEPGSEGVLNELIFEGLGLGGTGTGSTGAVSVYADSASETLLEIGTSFTVSTPYRVRTSIRGRTHKLYVQEANGELSSITALISEARPVGAS